MGIRSVALFKVGRDYGVTFLDLKLAGLKEAGEKAGRLSGELESIERELVGVVPRLEEMYALDVAMEDAAGRRYAARLYAHGGVIHYVVLISPKNTVRSLAKRLSAQGWKPLVWIEKKGVKRSAPSETDVQ
ncbi:hypothetical protein [Pyrobaculum sp.]|uniref:hypothetical protein n=1 Tax=Pyrobaculum sp. TaxID=2004705 RepID=UPI003D0B8B34